jgi:hypothetical protein
MHDPSRPVSRSANGTRWGPHRIIETLGARSRWPRRGRLTLDDLKLEADLCVDGRAHPPEGVAVVAQIGL